MIWETHHSAIFAVGWRNVQPKAPAQEGVAMARNHMPDLILMDLSLPVMDGWEATRQIKACAQTRRIPVIALTANAMAGDKDRALAAGCDDFDTKPIDFPRLLDKIRAHMPEGSP
jgi:CheY-like chemotaxis protein